MKVTLNTICGCRMITTTCTELLIRPLSRIWRPGRASEEDDGKDERGCEVTLLLLVEGGGPTYGEVPALPLFFNAVIIAVRQAMADVKQRTSLEKVLGEVWAKIGQLRRKVGPGTLASEVGSSLALM